MIYFMSPWDCQIRLTSYTTYVGRREFISTHSLFREWVVIVPESGEFDFEVEGESGTAGFGDMVFCNPRGRFWRHVTSNNLTYHVFNWSWLRDGELDEGAWRAGKWTVRDTVRLRANFDLLRTLVDPRDGYQLRRRANVLEDLLLLAWEGAYAPQPVLDPVMREAARLIREKALGPLGMVEISESVSLSPVQFTRRFRKAHGVTPIVFLTQIRLEYARNMLLITDRTLDEIAEHCGWASGQYFSKVFSEEMGMPPGKFRQLHRV